MIEDDAFEATFDYICHPMRCPRCGKIPPDPCDIDLQTKVGRVKKLRMLKIGDYLELDSNLREIGGYLELREAHDKTRLSVIETWSCSNCGANFLWARIVFENSILQSVEPIQLTDDTLESADFITNEVLTLMPMEFTMELKRTTPAKLRKELLLAENSHLEEQKKKS
jgi:hypothetical protein